MIAYRTATLSALLSGLLLAGEGLVALRLESMEYPRLALLAGIQGDVMLSCSLAEDGSVKHVSVVSGHKLLAAAAKAHVMKNRFGVLGDPGNSPERRVRLHYSFQLEGMTTAAPVSVTVFEAPNRITVTSQFQQAMIQGTDPGAR